MTTAQEWSDEFDTLVASYRRFKDFDNKELLDSVEFNEYEKSVFLTKAQNDLIKEFYKGEASNNSYERTEDVRRYLESLVKQVDYTSSDEGNKLVDKYIHTTYTLPEHLQYIVYEQIQWESEDKCTTGLISDVVPIQHDEYVRITRNPFRGPNIRRALRLDNQNKQVEIITIYPISKYTVRYVTYPKPIILADLPNESIDGYNTITLCELPEFLHRTILDIAVRTALSTKVSTTKDKDNDNK